MNERKLTSFDNGRDRNSGIRRGGGSEVGVIELRAVSGQEEFWIEELFNRDSRETPGGKG